MAPTATQVVVATAIRTASQTVAVTAVRPTVTVEEEAMVEEEQTLAVQVATRCRILVPI